jgi:3-oxoacyl-[acyl-carrier protein] reductase
MTAATTAYARAQLGLTGHRVVVIGGSSGMGAAAVPVLQTAGARVASFDLPTARWPKAVTDVAELTGAVDVTDEPTVAAALDTAASELGGIDAVVNCAGILGAVVPGIEETVADVQRLLSINLLGAFAVSRQALPAMIEQGYGRIVHVASIAGKEGNPQMTGYSASKAGMIAMVKSLGKEYAASGVTVNAIAPASIETPLIQGMTPERREVQKALIPARRFGTAEEVAHLIRFIVSPEASFTTGFVFDASGGRATY